MLGQDDIKLITLICLLCDFISLYVFVKSF